MVFSTNFRMINEIIPTVQERVDTLMRSHALVGMGPGSITDEKVRTEVYRLSDWLVRAREAVDLHRQGLRELASALEEDKRRGI